MRKRIDHVVERHAGAPLCLFVDDFKVKNGKIIDWRDIRIAHPPAGASLRAAVAPANGQVRGKPVLLARRRCPADHLPRGSDA